MNKPLEYEYAHENSVPGVCITPSCEPQARLGGGSAGLRLAALAPADAPAPAAPAGRCEVAANAGRAGASLDEDRRGSETGG